MLQIVTGIFLALHYTSDLNSAYYQIFFLIRSLLWTVFTLFSFCWSIICLSISISTSWKSYILWVILLFIFYLVFRNSSSLLLNVFYLHFLSSNNPLRNSTNNKIPFFPFIF